MRRPPPGPTGWSGPGWSSSPSAWSRPRSPSSPSSSFFGAENLPTRLNAVAGGGLTVGFGLALAGTAADARAPVPGADDPDLYVTNPHDRGERAT
jgi:hypothetical protein